MQQVKKKKEKYVIKVYLDFLGYHTLLSERDYWSKDDDLGVDLVDQILK